MTEYSIESGAALPNTDATADPLVEGILIGNDAFAHVPLTAIVASLTNPRKSFDAVKLTELADSIKASGVHQPILMRPLPGSRLADTFDLHFARFGNRTKDLPTYEIVAGERRYRACLQAGVSTIPSLIRDLTDHQVLEIQIIENLQRDDLSPLEEAEGYLNLCCATGITKDNVGTKIGKSRAYVYARIKLLDLSQDCKQALRSGSIDTSRALLIARIPDTSLQQKAVTEATRKDYKGDVISLRELQTWLQKNVMLRLEGAPFNIADAKLCKDAGSCKDCPKRTGANPDLFVDVDGADICTDPPCYQAKEAAHRTTLISKAEAKGMRVIDGKEATAIFRESFNSSSLGAYSRLDQRRHDASDSDAPTLRKLLGTDAADLKAQGCELVLIEHPRTKELIEAVSTVEAEALLITRGLIKQTKAAAKSDYEIERLKKSIDTQVKRESLKAIHTALVKDVHAVTTATKAADLITPDLLRAWLIQQSHNVDTDDMADCLNMYTSTPDAEHFDDEQIRLRIQNLPTSGLWKALAIFMIMADQPGVYSPDEGTPTSDALAKATGTDTDAIVKDTRATVKADIAVQIKALKAQIQPPKSASTPSRADDAFFKGEGGAKTKTKKPKTTAAEAHAAIAAAMQAQDQAQTPESETDSGAAIASQGNQASPVPVSGFALPVGAKVRVTANVAVLGTVLSKWAGKEGVVTRCAPGIDGWDVKANVSFKGRTGGVAAFFVSTLEVVPS